MTMDLTDALTITGLGMAVVFSGLLLTAGLIVAFGRLQVFLDAPPKSEKAPVPVAVHEPSTAPVVDPEILTVITTVLEVERRLHRVRGRGATETHHE